MASNIIKVNTDSLNSDAESIEGYLSNVKNCLENLREALQELDGMWDGPAKESFKKSYNDDLEVLQTVITNIERFNLFEKDAKDKYNECDSKVNDFIANLGW